MKILFLSQLVPYPIDAGPKARSYHVLQYLAEAGHDVTLAAFRRQNDKEEAIKHLDQFCSAVHTVLLRRSRFQNVFSLITSQINGTPFLIQRDDVAEMHNLSQGLFAQQSFDAIHADQLWMAQYALAIKSKFKPSKRPQLILDQHNAVFLIPQRLASGTNNPFKRLVLNLESKRLARYEVEVCNQFDHVVWVTKEDQAAVYQQATRSESPYTNDLVIPICVDPQEKLISTYGKKTCRITFLGGLHWPPNAQGVSWFAEKVFPEVRSSIPDAILTVIGKDPPTGLIGEGIEVTGYVQDLQPMLVETAVFIVPLLAGGGMRVKILDAWNWGIPIISTTIGAEGVKAVHEENMLIADTPEALSQATIRLFKEPELAKKLIQNGRATLETTYNWKTIYHAWDKIYPNG
jgi:glycosyltransferase involved in cell wall biosynthesis